MENDPVRRKFTAALDALVEQVKEDRSILAAILCGSLSHDTVWAKSDIDLVLVTIDDKKVERGRPGALRGRRQRPRLPHAARASSARRSKASVRNSFMHSLLAKGRLLYTHDETIADLCARLHEIGERDTQLQLLRGGDARAAADLQGPQVVRHARRPRLHRALDPLRRDAAGADRGDRRAPAGRPRGDPAGDEAESGVLQDRLHRPAQREEDAEERAGRARRGRRLPRRARARRCSRPVLDHLREVGEARSCHRDRGPLQAELRRRRRDHGVRVPGRPGAHRQGVHARPAHQEEQRRRAGAGLLLPRGASRMASKTTARRQPRQSRARAPPSPCRARASTT